MPPGPARRSRGRTKRAGKPDTERQGPTGSLHYFMMRIIPIRTIKSMTRPPHALATLGALLASAGAIAQTPAAATDTATLPTVEVSGFRGQQLDGVKYQRELKDTPRLVTVLPQTLLQEQGVNKLSDALRNLPGISLQAGEGNPPGGDQLKIRGFNARDDINVNGARDIGNYFRDPFYVDQLEVVKGPNSAFNGRGSAGGTINFVTKAPSLQERGRAEFSVGDAAHRRVTVDVNRPLDDNSAARLNLMGHDSEVAGRDLVHERRVGAHLAYAWGFKGDTRIDADLLLLRQSDRPDAGLPLDRDPRGTHSRGSGSVPPVDFDNYYGHVDDFKKLEAQLAGLRIRHRLGADVELSNQTRIGRVHNDSITASPRIRDIPAASAGFEGARVRGDTKPRDQTDTSFVNQTALAFSADTGSLRHDLVTGIEIGRFEYANDRRPDVSGPLTDLFDPQPRQRPVVPYDGTRYSFETKELGAYLLDTVKLAPRWELNLGLRWDRVEAKAWEAGRENLPTPGDNRSLSRRDSAWSHSIGLVHQLTPRASLYAATGSAFEISGNFDRNQVQLAGGATARVADAATFNIAPEKTRAFELGAKWRVGTDLDLNAALFRTDKKNARFPGQAGGDNSILDAKLRVQGFEFLTAGRLSPGWRIYSGYVFLDSEVQAAPSRPFAVGQPLGGSPRHSANLFTLYDLTPQISVGGGVQRVSGHYSAVQATATGTVKIHIPGYTVFDLYGNYKLSAQTQIRVNVYNLADKDYLLQVAEGGGQGIPGRGRQLVATLRHDF